MPEAGSSTIVIMLAVIAGLLFLIFLKAVGIGARLARIEQALAKKPVTGTVAETAPAVSSEALSGGMFESFLDEDPARKSMTKREQAAAYRIWRQKKGMNWSNS